MNCLGKLFSDPLSMWLLISINVLIKSYEIWLLPKILDLTVIGVPDGYIAGGCLWNISSEILLIIVIDDQSINQHAISD